MREYQVLYPKDRVVIKGGYAAFLQLQRCGIEEQAKDIDVIVESADFSGTVAGRWKELLPDYEMTGEYGVYTFKSQKGGELDIDLFINQGESTFRVDRIDGVLVHNLEELITSYSSELKGRRSDEDCKNPL